MTGRRLYELVTDARGEQMRWEAVQLPDDHRGAALRPGVLPAWGSLMPAERRLWTHAAARITPAEAKR